MNDLKDGKLGNLKIRKLVNQEVGTLKMLV
jgi:hypothetical protein